MSQQSPNPSKEVINFGKVRKRAKSDPLSTSLVAFFPLWILFVWLFYRYGLPFSHEFSATLAGLGVLLMYGAGAAAIACIFVFWFYRMRKQQALREQERLLRDEALVAELEDWAGNNSYDKTALDRRIF